MDTTQNTGSTGKVYTTDPSAGPVYPVTRRSVRKSTGSTLACYISTAHTSASYGPTSLYIFIHFTYFYIHFLYSRFYAHTRLYFICFIFTLLYIPFLRQPPPPPIFIHIIVQNKGIPLTKCIEFDFHSYCIGLMLAL